MRYEKIAWNKQWCFIALIGLMGLFPACKNEQDLDFQVTFRDAKSLAPGQFVVYRGIQIGEVKSVELGDDRLVRAQLRIDEEHSGKVYREARFVIEKPGGVMDLSGERQITVHDRGSTQSPIADGDLIKGSEGRLGDLANLAKDNWDTASDQVVTWISEVSSTPEAQELKDSLLEFKKTAEEVSAEKFEEFRKEQLPVVTEKMRRLKEQMEELGQSEKARELSEQFEDWLEQTQLEQTGEVILPYDGGRRR